MTRHLLHTASHPRTLDYAALVHAYHKGLTEHLRGFDAGLPELAFWVPDENIAVGVRNLLDALATAGRDEVRLHIAAPASSCLEVSGWRELATRYGDAEVESHPSGIDLHLRSLRVAVAIPDASAPQSPSGPRAQEVVVALSDPSPETLPDALGPHHSLAAWARAGLEHDALPSGGAGERCGIARRGSVAWGIAVDADGVVRRAGFAGAPHVDAALLLERLCVTCEGLPLLEVRDHAVLKLEASLRREPYGGGGIVVPEFADPAFAFLTRLVRDAVRELGVPLPAVNTYDPGLSETWRAASDEARRERLETALRGFCHDEALPPEAIALVDLQLGVRVVVGFAEEVPREHTGPALLRLERVLKAEVDARLEVFLVEERDRNRKRRLAIFPPAPEDRS